MKYKKFISVMILTILFIPVFVVGVKADTEQYYSYYAGMKIKSYIQVYNGNSESNMLGIDGNGALRQYTNGTPTSTYTHLAGKDFYYIVKKDEYNQYCMFIHHWNTTTNAYEDILKNNNQSIKIHEVVEWSQLEDNPQTSVPPNSLTIVLPMYDGFKDTTPMQVINFVWSIPWDDQLDNMADVKIQVFGGVAGSGHTISAKTEKNGTQLIGIYSIEREMQIGENQVVVKLTHNNVEYMDTRWIIRLAEQVDNNGDGIDDNTGLPIWEENVNDGTTDNVTDGIPTLPGENATIFDYIKYLFDSIIWVFSSIVKMTKSVASSIGQMGQVFSSIFKWIPEGMLPIIMLGLTVTVVLRIFKR